MWKVDENSSSTFQCIFFSVVAVLNVVGYYNLIAGLDTLPTAEVTSAAHRPSLNP